MRILVVDDEPSIREFVDVVLRDAGHDTVVAADGQDALEKPGRFDLLVTDVMMPRMGGDMLAVQMFKRDPRLRVLYMTAFSDALFKKKVTLWEGEAFLDKPLTADVLLEAVDLLMHGRPARRRSSR
jgi:DNA-binding response OmpR family regulator